jgi:hypothetical protein
MSEILELSEKIDKLELDFSNFNAKYTSDILNMMSVKGKIEHLERGFDEHDKYLVRGNGVPSVMEDIRTIKKFMDKVNFWITAIGLAFMGQFVVFIFGAVILFIEVLPKLYTLIK